ncbi:MAG TPA: type II toxin-antitoxin system MqsA family antitoxin [Hyphomicrobiales bacterium]|nr:type II toxin-antitoxin system MqsA family antitoxin [Hyphomicrobiales bacterium]
MKCPACLSPKLVQRTRNLPYTYNGETTDIPKVSGQYCSACGESVLDATEAARVSAAMLEFNKQVDTAKGKAIATRHTSRKVTPELPELSDDMLARAVLKRGSDARQTRALKR